MNCEDVTPGPTSVKQVNPLVFLCQVTFPFPSISSIPCIMLFSLLAVLAFSALAVASQFSPRFFERRQDTNASWSNATAINTHDTLVADLPFESDL